MKVDSDLEVDSRPALCARAAVFNAPDTPLVLIHASRLIYGPEHRSCGPANCIDWILGPRPDNIWLNWVGIQIDDASVHDIAVRRRSHESSVHPRRSWTWAFGSDEECPLSRSMMIKAKSTIMKDRDFGSIVWPARFCFCLSSGLRRSITRWAYHWWNAATLEPPAGWYWCWLPWRLLFFPLLTVLLSSHTMCHDHLSKKE